MRTNAGDEENSELHVFLCVSTVWFVERMRQGSWG
jgi:hypothetical protein